MGTNHTPITTHLKTRKDYSHFVEFPVEIVGRDGIIREYTFEQSIELYQYRIKTARSKSTDSTNLRYEVEHCTKRIAQIRRSFFAHYAWESFHCDQTPHILNTTVAGELAAYLRRRLGAGIHRPQINLKILEQSDVSVLFYFPIQAQNTTLLLHLFTTTEAHQNYINSIDISPNNNQVELMVDQYISDDLSIVLCSLHPLDQNIFIEESNKHPRNEILKRGYESILKGYTGDALDAFVTAYQEHPYYRGAYWGAAIVADQFRAYAESEFALKMGVHHFPSDAGLQLRLAAALVRRHANDTHEQLIKAQHLNGQSELLDFLFAVHQIQNNAILNPISKLKDFELRLKRYPGVLRTQKWLLKLLINRFIITVLLILTTGVAALCSSIFSVWFLALAVIMMVSLFSYRLWWKRMLSRSLQAVTGRQIHLLPSSDLNEILKSLLHGQ